MQTEEDAIQAQLGKSRVEINELAIRLGLPLFCGTVLLMLSIPIFVQGFGKKTGSEDQVKAIFASGILVEIITVLLLTMSILILGLSGKIEGPVLGTLLGGISGYVLNRFRGRNQDGGPDGSSNQQPGTSQPTNANNGRKSGSGVVAVVPPVAPPTPATPSPPPTTSTPNAPPAIAMRNTGTRSRWSMRSA